jgi:hypothetical protein
MVMNFNSNRRRALKTNRIFFELGESYGDQPGTVGYFSLSEVQG